MLSSMKNVISVLLLIKMLMRASFVNRGQLVVPVSKVSQGCQMMVKRHVRHGRERGQRGCVEVSVVGKVPAGVRVTQWRHARRIDAFFLLTSVAKPDANDFLFERQIIADHSNFLRCRFRVSKEGFL